MAQPLRVLIAEDNPADAELVVLQLRRAGFEPEWERVDTEARYLERLQTNPDVILSDYNIPGFGGLRALDLLQAGGREIPFIIISGTIGEETAVEAMKHGAADYLLKDRLARLGSAVTRAVEQARLRRERKEAEALLRRSEAEFRGMTEASPLGIFVADCDGLITYANFTLRRMLDVGFREVVGSGWVRSVHPQDRNELRAKWQEAIAGKQRFESDARCVRPDGTTIHVNVRTAVMREDEHILGYVGAVQDVTERKRAEERIREQASMLDHAHDAIIVRDIHTGRITFWNKGAEGLYGWTAAEAEGRDIGELLFADPGTLDGITGELLTTGESRGDRKHVTKAGKELTVSSHVTLVRDDTGTPKSALVINIDITEQKNLEARMLRAQRMESIGTLASGVAHDLNNILAPIMMSVPVLRMKNSDAERERIISTIEMSAERGAQIVKQVLTFGRGIEGERRRLQFGPLFGEIVKIVRGTFPKSITIDSTIKPDAWPVLGDATQMHQILLNLCINARDAMPAGGKLRLGARNLLLDASFSSMMPGTTPGPYVLLEVSDNGTGIPPEIIERIFDPFFTTKGIGDGTGLGLSTVLGIVKSHGGHITVASTPGTGTTFQIYLPASADAEEGQTVPDPGTPPPQGHGECILVVDDEAAVRATAQDVLEMNGYRTLQAADGTEALVIFAQNSETVAAVLTDLMMPLMDGIALIRALRAMVPHLPILASTGLAEKTRTSELEAMNVKCVLAKPYGANALLHAIDGALHPGAVQADRAP